MPVCVHMLFVMCEGMFSFCSLVYLFIFILERHFKSYEILILTIFFPQDHLKNCPTVKQQPGPCQRQEKSLYSNLGCVSAFAYFRSRYCELFFKTLSCISKSSKIKSIIFIKRNIPRSCTNFPPDTKKKN